MDTAKLNKWADLLLDTGKRNNLVNFKDTKSSTVEIVTPDSLIMLEKINHTTAFEVFDPKIEDKDDEAEELQEKNVNETHDKSDNIFIEKSENSRLSRADYIKLYSNRLKKNGQILIFNSDINPIRALKNIAKKAKTAIEETGVNIAYLAFGFIHWTENENSQYEMKAPILLVPISIENESAVEPFYVKVIEDDFIVNPTFSFKLQNDYGIKLPDYNEDDGAKVYFDKILQLVSKLKWTVSTECKIGVFSFLKINMYKDLKDNSSVILKNKNIRALLGENIDTATIIEDSAGSKPQTMDLLDLHTVVDADSSQSEAIDMAREGKSFVLQGPPGTGKSQTITNIISECLAENKKVLFVSEKLAALSVVYDKLKKAGLEDFCLELHSHKTSKKQVIDNLCHTLKEQKTTISDRVQKELSEKKNAQHNLDLYAEELHVIRPLINKSLYAIYEEVAACRKSADIEFIIPNVNNKGEEYLEKVDNLLSCYERYTKTIGYDYHNNVWYGYDNLDNSLQFFAQVKSDLKSTERLSAELQSINQILIGKYKIEAENIFQALAYQAFFNLVKSSEFVTPKLLSTNILDKTYHTIELLNKLAKIILKNTQVLKESYDDDIFKIDAQKISKQLSKQFSSFFSRMFSKEYKKIVNSIRLCKNDGKKINYKVALNTMQVLCSYQTDMITFLEEEKKIQNVLSEKFCGVNTNFELLKKELNCLIVLKEKIKYAELYSLSQTEFDAEKQFFEQISKSINEVFSLYGPSEVRLSESFIPSEYDMATAPLVNLEKKCQYCFDSIDKIDDWCRFRKILNDSDELEMREFIDNSIKNKIEPEKLILSFNKNFYKQWIDNIIRNSAVLSELSRIPHDQMVELFKQKDELNFDINKAKIRAQLSAQRPSLDMVAQGSAISILLREGEKKRKQKGVRQLLSEIGELVQTIKPCFLMSPLSVSTFLSAEMKFDLVVFDEASQIFPQDAVGAIYRGKQLIVVGDSKQMPPSNFFNSSVETEEDEEIEDITDFESVLDLCSTSLPQKRLKWHYRSRSEQLISFSNMHFYDNELITFPSSKVDTLGTGVNYFYVNGTFDRHSKTNHSEAVRIVDLIFDNIDKYPQRSLGVVAFSISQQNLIDNLLSKRRQQDLSKEFFFKQDKSEPFFVKNLETVQGDERDTIIFSIAYAQDTEGRLLLNFGPINREGGERRLNVAVTRAKINIQLVTSMHYSDIDLSRTKSNGARLLREYLDYAENGNIALERALKVNAFEQFDSEFEMEVCEFLQKNGFSVDTQVGCSSFKIDLAIKNPNTSNYILAIECDGASYHSSKNARDRDRLRQEILERMGWKFYRIWSTDWFRNKRNEQARLINAAKTAIEQSAVDLKKENEVNETSFEEIVIEKQFEFPKYKMIEVSSISVKCGKNLLKIIREVLETESPLSEEWLLKRIACLFGREKVTSYVTEQYGIWMKNCSQYGIIIRNKFLYLKDAEIPMLRVPEENDTPREIKYISTEELGQGLKELLKQNVLADKNGLFKLLVQQLGFCRMGDAILERLEAALKLIDNDIQRHGNNLLLK